MSVGAASWRIAVTNPPNALEPEQLPHVVVRSHGAFDLVRGEPLWQMARLVFLPLLFGSFAASEFRIADAIMCFSVIGLILAVAHLPISKPLLGFSTTEIVRYRHFRVPIRLPRAEITNWSYPSRRGTLFLHRWNGERLAVRCRLTPEAHEELRNHLARIGVREIEHAEESPYEGIPIRR